MVAAAKGHRDFVDVLLKHGADVNARDVYGWTPVARASFEKRLDVVRALVTVEELDLNARDDQGATALHHAASVGASDIIELLLTSGADPDIKDYKELTALDRARARSDDRSIQALTGG